MEDIDWLGCSLIEIDPERVSGAPVFKNTRLPVETITDNIDAYMDAGLPLDRAIAETLVSFPSTPGGADGIRAVPSIVPRTNASFSFEDHPRRRGT